MKQHYNAAMRGYVRDKPNYAAAAVLVIIGASAVLAVLLVLMMAADRRLPVITHIPTHTINRVIK